MKVVEVMKSIRNKNFPYYSFIIVLVVWFTSCGGVKKKTQTEEQVEKSEKFQLVKDFDYVHLIPDSLRTPEQKNLFLLLQDILTKNMVIENNHFTFKLSKKEFLEKGIPEPYFDLIMNDIKQNNAYIDSTGLTDVDRLLEESFQKLRNNPAK